MKILRFMGVLGCFIASGSMVQAAAQGNGEEDLDICKKACDFGAMLLRNAVLAESGAANPIGLVCLARVDWKNTLQRDYQPAYENIRTSFQRLSERSKQLHADAFTQLCADFESMRLLTNHSLNSCDPSIKGTPDEIKESFFSGKSIASSSISVQPTSPLADRHPAYLMRVVDRAAHQYGIELTENERANVLNALSIGNEGEVQGQVKRFETIIRDVRPSLGRIDKVMWGKRPLEEKLQFLQSWVRVDVPRICQDVSRAWEVSCRHDFFADDFDQRAGINIYENMYHRVTEYFDDINRARRGESLRTRQMITVVAAVKEAQRQAAAAGGEESAEAQQQRAQQARIAAEAAQKLLLDDDDTAKPIQQPKQKQPAQPKKSEPRTWYTFGGLHYPMAYDLPTNRVFEIYGSIGHGVTVRYTGYFISAKGAVTELKSPAAISDGAVILPDGQAKAMWQNAQNKDLKVLIQNAEQQRAQVRNAKEAAKKRELEARRAIAAARVAAGGGFAAVAAQIVSDVAQGTEGALPAPTSEAKSGKKLPSKKKAGAGQRNASTSPTSSTSSRSPGYMQHILVPQSGALEEHVTEAHLVRGTMTPSGLHANGVSGLLCKLVNAQGRSVVSGIGKIALATSREELCAMQPEKSCFRITWQAEDGQAKVSDCWPLDWTLDRVMQSIGTAARNVCEQLSGPNEDGVAMYLGTPSDLPRGARGICLLTRNDPSGTPVLVSAWPVLEETKEAAGQ